MKLTRFSHAILLIMAGMVLSLFVGHWGRNVYAGILIVGVAAVLLAEWRQGPRAACRHEADDADAY